MRGKCKVLAEDVGFDQWTCLTSVAAEATRAHIPGSGKERGWPTHIMTRGDGNFERPSPPVTRKEQIMNRQAFFRDARGCRA